MLKPPLLFSFPVGVSVDDDFACHGAHAHSSPPFKSVWNGTWAAVWFLNVVFVFIYSLTVCSLVLLALLVGKVHFLLTLTLARRNRK